MSQCRIWTQNVFLRPPPIKNNEDDYKQERFSLILQHIANFDIVCFQEMFQTATSRPQTLISTAIKLGFHYWAIGDKTNFFTGIPTDSGLIVLSKYPISFSHFSSYEVGVLSDSASDKGYIYCAIQINGSTLHLFNTHLQASYANNAELQQISIATRLHQAKILKKQIQNHLQQNYQTDDLVLIVGDLNVDAMAEKIKLSENSPIKTQNKQSFREYQEVMNLLRKGVLSKKYEARDLLKQNEGFHPPTYGQEQTMILTDSDDHNIPQRLDYILQISQTDASLSLQPILSTCKVEKGLVKGHPFTQISDHFGITLTINIK